LPSQKAVKKILLIDNTFDPPHGCPEIQALVKRAAEGLGEVEITAVRAPEGKIPAGLEGFDGVVLSGSKTGIEETEPWIEAEMSAIRRLFELKIPTFGICYGEQLIARTFGAPAGKAKQYEYGWVQIEAGQSPLFEGLPSRFYSFEYHSDEVRSLPPSFRLTASSRDCPIQAYDVDGAPMWGVQFHPERGVEHGKRSIARALGEKRAVTNAEKGEELFDPAVGETIFRNFLKRVWTRR
jgi:GMP synthase-like glutamine amidotransferase